jgi:putative endonuclease
MNSIAAVVARNSSRSTTYRLVHVEEYASPQDAIAREKQLKNWHRDWKIRLIGEDNPDWSDLSHLL